MSVQCHILCIGKNKDVGLQRMIDDYRRKMDWKVTITELPAPQVSDADRKIREAELLETATPAKAIRIVLDERGENLTSPVLAQKLQHYFINQHSTLVFCIGGADGLDENFRRKAHFALSFGALTWPHMLARLMLVEQLYRVSTILNNHPYHRS